MGATKLDGDQCPVVGVDGLYVVTEGVCNVGFSSFSLSICWFIRLWGVVNMNGLSRYCKYG